MLPDLLDEYCSGQRDHHRDIHGAHRDKHDHETPAATNAVKAVVNANSYIAGRTLVARIMEERTKGRSTMAKAGTFQRCELVDAGHCEDSNADPSSSIGRLIGQLARADQRDVNESTERRPRAEVAAEE